MKLYVDRYKSFPGAFGINKIHPSTFLVKPKLTNTVGFPYTAAKMVFDLT